MDTNIIKRKEIFPEAENVAPIIACNEASARFGLTLSEHEAKELVAVRNEALKANGRVEFGGRVLPDMIFAFCDSPYIRQQEYLSTLCALTELFYTYKNELGDCFPDNELICRMKEAFDGRCKGSLELLSDIDMLFQRDPEKEEDDE